MFEEIEITKDLSGSFKRILRRIPKEMKKNKYILKIATAYLKIGGEKLAKQSIEIFKITDKLERTQRKQNRRNEALLRAAEARKTKKMNENNDNPNTDINAI